MSPSPPRAGPAGSYAGLSLTLWYPTMFMSAGILSALCYTFMKQSSYMDDTYIPRFNREGSGYNKMHHDALAPFTEAKASTRKVNARIGMYQVPRIPTPQRMRSGCTTIRFPGDFSGGGFVCFEKGRALSSSGSVSVTESQPESMGHRT